MLAPKVGDSYSAIYRKTASMIFYAVHRRTIDMGVTGF